MTLYGTEFHVTFRSNPRPRSHLTAQGRRCLRPRIRAAGRRKKSKTRSDLHGGRGQLYSTANGFDETTTSDIAERADVSQRTLFRHFPTKEALLYGDMDDLLARPSGCACGQTGRPTSRCWPSIASGSMLSLALTTLSATGIDGCCRQSSPLHLSVGLRPTAEPIVQAQWEREIIVSGRRTQLGVDPMIDPRP